MSVIKFGNGQPVSYVSPEYIEGQEIVENDPEITANIKAWRNHLLAETDFYMVTDSPLSADAKQQMVNYRQALRDLDYNDHSLIDFTNANWPSKPQV